jgi:hypothetical protein
MGADPLRVRQLTMNGIREKLAAGDEQWKRLGPLIEKVLEKQREARTGAGIAVSSPPMVRGTPPPPPGVGAQQWQSGGGNVSRSGAGMAMVDTPTGRAMQEIRAALDQVVSDAELLAKVATMRAARDAARAEVVAAQKELKELCGARAEAVLVTMGVLE